LILFFFSGWVKAFAEGIIESFGEKGEIDWKEGVIIAKGVGASPESVVGGLARIMAMRAAKVDAYRNLLEIVKGVRVNSESRVENFMLKSDVINTKVNGFVKGAKVIKKEYYHEERIAEVTIQAPLKGNLSLVDIISPSKITSVAPKFVAKDVYLCPTCGQIWPKEKPLPKEVQAAKKRMKGEVYTGLIVDAKGLGLRPCMAPRIVTEDGREVYGSAYVAREFVLKYGMVGYLRSLEHAKKSDRVAPNPLIVKGIKAVEPGRTDVVISFEDAIKLHQMRENLSFLEKCRVIIVLD
jgi:hypothetical protein